MSSQNVVPSKLYTTEGSTSKKRSEDDLKKDDPAPEQGLAIVGNKKVYEEKNEE